MDQKEANNIHQRLSRMEQQLEEKLVEVVVALARMEERLASNADLASQPLKRIEDHESRLRKLEAAVKHNSLITDGVLKFTGWVVAAGISLGFFFFKQ